VAECLVRIVDKINPDPFLDSNCTKAGDFITVQDDNWSWGTEEVNSTSYNILIFPNISWLDIEYLTRLEILPPSSPYRQKRAFNFDVLTLPPRKTRAWVGNKVTLKWSLATLKARIKTKTPINDPNVI